MQPDQPTEDENIQAVPQDDQAPVDAPVTPSDDTGAGVSDAPSEVPSEVPGDQAAPAEGEGIAEETPTDT